MESKYDKLIVGIVAGLIIPILGYFMVTSIFELMVSSGNMDEVTFGIGQRRERTVYLLAICCNILPFNYFKNKRMDDAIRGVVFPTMLFVILWIYRYYDILF